MLGAVAATELAVHQLVKPTGQLKQLDGRQGQHVQSLCIHHCRGGALRPRLVVIGPQLIAGIDGSRCVGIGGRYP